MPYSEKEYKTSNINYVNKDFLSLKDSLVEYSKTYFPDTYRDFNETSPGMMLIEMAAYVGDVLNFYIDQQYKEMMLPLAQERRNIVNIAKMLGYRVKASTPAYSILKFSQTVSSDTTDVNNIIPDFSQAVVVDKGAQIKSVSNSSIIFETLDFIDFKTSSSIYNPVETTFDDNGVVSEYTLYREVLAVAGETKTKTFSIGSPQKFLKLQLPENNVIEILNVKDANGNTWYEVDYLAQDKVSIETHYSQDPNRTNAYSYLSGDTTEVLEVPVPYSLQYMQTAKRFVIDIDESGFTTLNFGNGVLRNGAFSDSDFLALTQVGMVIPGELPTVDINIDPLNADNRSTLGETPANTNLTVTYRVGGGIQSNVSTSDITNIFTKNIIEGPGGTTLTCTNENSAHGGSSGETIEEIRRNSMAFFASQNRCVTREDYEARILNLPSKFGNISKVFVDRRNPEELYNQVSGSISNDGTMSLEEWNLIYGSTESYEQIPSIDAYVLSYDSDKKLKALPSSTDGSPHPLKTNIKNYISNYRMMTDSISLVDGYIINFGVAFEVVAHRSANKADVKLRCINKIIQYFNIDKMQFHQTLYTGDLIYQLMDVEGVRAVNWVELTQNFNDLINGTGTLNLVPSDNIFIYDKEYVSGCGIGPECTIEYTVNDSNHDGVYGWKYDFKSFYGPNSLVGDGIILPSVTPSVFELKNSNKNIRGKVK